MPEPKWTRHVVASVRNAKLTAKRVFGLSAFLWGIAMFLIWVFPRLQVPPLNPSAPGSLYLLSAAAQAVAAVAGLVFTVALVVAQMSARYSQKVLSEFFDSVTAATVTFYVIAICSSLWFITEPSVVGVRLSFSLTVSALLVLVPYFFRFRARLDPESMVARFKDRASGELSTMDEARDGSSLSWMNVLDDVAFAALTGHDYTLLRSTCQAIGQMAIQAETRGFPLLVGEIVGVVRDVALAGVADPRAPVVACYALTDVGEESIANGHWITLDNVCDALGEIATTATNIGAATAASRAVASIGRLIRLVRASGHPDPSRLIRPLVEIRESASVRSLATVSALASDILGGRYPDGSAPRGANLLLNASFELGHEPGWRKLNAPEGVRMHAYPSAENAREGAFFLQANSRIRDGSVAQDLAVAPVAGESYSFSAWVRAQDAAPEQPFDVRLALWALGGPEDKGTTYASVGAKWELVSVPLDVAYIGHRMMRAEIYIDALDRNVDIDGAQVVRSLLTNSSFEMGPGLHGWESEGSIECSAMFNAHEARDGMWYLVVTSAGSEAAIIQNVRLGGGSGTYRLSIWVRGHGRSIGRVAIRGPHAPEGWNCTAFTASHEWTLVSVAYEGEGDEEVRIGVLVDELDGPLEVDGALLTFTGLRNASFESDDVYWEVTPNAERANIEIVSAPGLARENERALMVTPAAGKVVLVRKVVHRIEVGESSSYGLWLRTLNGEQVQGALKAVFEESNIEEVLTHFVLGGDWGHVSVPFDVPAPVSGYRLELTTERNVALLVDSEGISHGSARK